MPLASVASSNGFSIRWSLSPAPARLTSSETAVANSTGRSGSHRPRPPGELRALHAGHPDVGDQQVDGVGPAGQHVQGGVGLRGVGHAVAEGLEHPPAERADRRGRPRRAARGAAAARRPPDRGVGRIGVGPALGAPARRRRRRPGGPR